EGERRLARSAQTSDHRQGIPGDLNVDVFEVVLARAPDRNLLYRQWFSVLFRGGGPTGVFSEGAAQGYSRILLVNTSTGQSGLHCAGAKRAEVIYSFCLITKGQRLRVYELCAVTR